MPNTYKLGKGGYDPPLVLRVIANGGGVESDGQKISFKDAKKVLVLARVVPFKQGEKSQCAAPRS
jgi:hypothetical protein